ncbi:hypothetical protein Tco_1107010 [Tanacetum coccineum]
MIIERYWSRTLSDFTAFCVLQFVYNRLRFATAICYIEDSFLSQTKRYASQILSDLAVCLSTAFCLLRFASLDCDLSTAICLSSSLRFVIALHYDLSTTSCLLLHSADMGNSNIIPYEQYVKHNEGLVIPSGESSVPNDAYLMHENSAYVPDDSLTTKLNIYKEQVAIYEQRAKFELTDREQKMDDQMRMLIQERAQNPFYLRKAKVAQLALYDGDEILKTHHVPDVFYTVTDSALSASQFHDLSIAYNVAMTRVVELEYENTKLLNKIQHDSHDTMSSKDVPEFNTFFELSILDDQIQGHRNTIQQLDHFKAENEKVKQHYQEIYNSIKVTCVKTIERTTSLQTKIENLKTQLKGKMPCVTNNVVTPKVYLLLSKVAIEVEPIPPSQRNNRNVQQGYLNHLKDTLDALCEIVEEARSKRTSDNSLEYACVYTKTSQELLENMIASCLKTVNKRDRYNASTHTKRKKHVTFAEPLETSNHSTSKPVQHPEVKKSNVPISPSTEVNSDTKASRQTWKETGKLFANVGDQWKFTLGEQCPLTRITKPKVVPVRQWKPTGRIIPLGEQCPVTRSIASTSAPIVVETQAPMVPIVPDNACTNQLDPNSNWGSGTPNSPFLSVFKCRSYRSSCDIWTQAVHNI